MLPVASRVTFKFIVTDVDESVPEKCPLHPRWIIIFFDILNPVVGIDNPKPVNVMERPWFGTEWIEALPTTKCWTFVASVDQEIPSFFPSIAGIDNPFNSFKIKGR